MYWTRGVSEPKRPIGISYSAESVVFHRGDKTWCVSYVRRNSPPGKQTGVAGLLTRDFSAGVGVLFGLLPARRAAALNPIEALRHD